MLVTFVCMQFDYFPHDDKTLPKYYRVIVYDLRASWFLIFFFAYYNFVYLIFLLVYHPQSNRLKSRAGDFYSLQLRGKFI